MKSYGHFCSVQKIEIKDLRNAPYLFKIIKIQTRRSSHHYLIYSFRFTFPNIYIFKVFFSCRICVIIINKIYFSNNKRLLITVKMVNLFWFVIK